MFANVNARHLVEEGGVYHKAMRALRKGWQRAGCEVAQLLNRRTDTMANMSCELVESTAFAVLCEDSWLLCRVT